MSSRTSGSIGSDLLIGGNRSSGFNILLTSEGLVGSGLASSVSIIFDSTVGTGSGANEANPSACVLAFCLASSTVGIVVSGLSA